jgi:hypothetical protein
MMVKLGHTPYIEKQIVELAIESLAISTMSGANYVCVEPQNDPILHEHVIQGPQVTLGKALLILVHLSTPIIRNYLPI